MAITDTTDRVTERSARDRLRHRQKVREAIKGNIADILSEESLIGKDKKDRVVKVPIRGVKEYRFIYGDNASGVGQGEGVEPGQTVGQGGEPKQGDQQAGDQPGVDYYEAEVPLEELIDIMFEDLKLPDEDKKKLKEIEIKTRFKRKGARKKGPRNKLLKKKTAEVHVRSMQEHKRAIAHTEEEIRKLREIGASDPSKLREADELEKVLREHQREIEEIRKKMGVQPKAGWIPIKNEDLRHSKTVPDIRRESNAVVLCIMDTSGSMDTTKKYLARSFFFLLCQFVRTRYLNVEIVFIAHHTEGKEVTEEEFFHKGESGGTFISSGYKKALEVIEERYSPALWNVYTFHCSDGDNFESDNPEAIRTAQELAKVANLFGYIEIKPTSYYYGSSMMRAFNEQVKSDNFQTVLIKDKDDIFPKFKELISKDRSKEDQR